MKIPLWKTAFSVFGTIFFPLLYILNALVVYINAETFSAPVSMQILGVIIAFTGAGIWIVTMIQLRKGFGVLPQKQKRIKTGLYTYFNHPMYAGIYMTFLGMSLANLSWQGLFFLTVILLPTLVIRAVFEDKNLS